MTTRIGSFFRNLLLRRPEPARKALILEAVQASAETYRSKRRRKLRGTAHDRHQGLLRANRKVEELARKIVLASRTSASSRVKLDKLSLNLRKALLTSKMKESIFLSGLIKDRSTVWKQMHSRLRQNDECVVNIKDLTFFENPNGTMMQLREIADAEASSLHGRLNFFDQDCLDLGAWLVLAVMRRDMIPIFTGGAISDGLSRVIKSLNLHKELSFNVDPPAYSKDMWAFPYKSRRPAGSSKSPTVHLDPQTKEVVADELCEQLNVWLHQASNLQLAQQGRRMVSLIVGETLDNAERHGRPDYPDDGDWSISGYMKKTKNGGRESYICQLAFLSIGASISETVQKCPKGTLEAMDEYVEMHQPAFPNHQFIKEHLASVYALQDGVSGDAKAIEEGRGGTGFRDIINLFGDLAVARSEGNTAKLAIVSGRTCLHIASDLCEASHPRRDQPFNIWLNLENVKHLPPRSTSVIELDHYFSGTLITMMFELDPDYLEGTSK